MKKIGIAFIVFIGISFSSFSKAINFSMDKEVPFMDFNENSELTVLNAPLGSRFTLSLISKQNGMNTGCLGFDNDDLRELMIAVNTSEGEYCFRTSDFTANQQYLDNQKIGIGMTSMKLEGTHPSGLQVSVTVVNPFTPTDSLQETSKIKASIAPAFYLLIDIKNNNNAPVKGNIKIGFQSVNINSYNMIGRSKYWLNKPTNAVYYKDPSDGKTHDVLANLNKDTVTHHYRQEGFNGLKVPFNIEENKSIQHQAIYATHYDKEVMYDEKKNMSLKFYYNKFWNGLNEVLGYARKNASKNIDMANKFENVLKKSGTSPKEKWITALSFHNDLANAYLLIDEKKEPRFYLVEGRFKHLSTIDVAHETELNAIFMPWRLKLQIRQWLDYVVFQKTLIQSKGKQNAVPEGVTAAKFGPYLYHDVGDYPYVMEGTGYDFGPYMAIEENSNFPVLLYWYWKMTGNDEFVKKYLGLVDVLLQSMINRDSDNSGLADRAIGWSTYDVSEAIKKSRENVYLGVKQFCAYVLSAQMFKALAAEGSEVKKSANFTGEEIADGLGQGRFKYGPYNNEYLRQRQAKRYLKEAEKILKTLKEAKEEYGYIPVSLDQNFSGWDQYSVVLGEGLMYPALTNNQHPLFDEIEKVLQGTYEKAYNKSQTSYGIKLSSEESVTWFSKIMVSDIIADRCFGKDGRSSANYTYEWNKNNYNAYQDGAYNKNKPWEGNWYPRGISSLGYLLLDKNFKGNRQKYLQSIGY